MNYYIGLDVGGTKIAAGLIFGKKIIKKVKTQTSAKASKYQVIKNICSSIDSVYSQKIKGIGIGIAGQIDQKNGILISSPNFGKDFKNIKIKKIISQKFKKPVLLENDANCFALGESIYGQGKNCNPIVGLTLGTGVGGGIVINKKIYHGKNGLAGEIGHSIIKENGLFCSCGQKGHLEAYASGTAMSKIYQNLTGKKEEPIYVEQKFYQKDRAAIKTFNIMSESLAYGLINIIRILDPQIIVLGGGLSKVRPIVNLAIILAKKQTNNQKTKIIASKLKDDAAILGASLLFN